MPNLLITPNEVVELAFSPHDQIDPARITDSRIEAAQLKFLAPALKKMYTALTEGLYDDFCRESIKPALACYVKYHLFPDLAVRVGSDGVIRLHTADSTPADPSEIARLRRESREAAHLLLHKALRYLKEHAAEFPEFAPEECRINRPRINGGIIL
jgi:hypothetical protein